MPPYTLLATPYTAAMAALYTASKASITATCW